MDTKIKKAIPLIITKIKKEKKMKRGANLTKHEGDYMLKITKC